MVYSRFQQSLSSLIIVAIFLSQTIRFIGVDSIARADAIEENQIVSLIVEESAYDTLQDEIDEYAQDIQSRMSKTRAVVFTVASDLNPYQVASLNERLYYEGIQWEGLARLVGTVIIGKVPLPIVHDGNRTYPSIWPYTDFNEKAFRYNETRGLYERSNDANQEIPEIWHGVISPNTGDASGDIDALRAFFAKNHQAVARTGVFSITQTQNPPYVFHYDGFSDQETLRASEYAGYRLYQENIEDIVYRRYNKYFAQRLADAYRAAQESDGGTVAELSDDAELNALVAASSSGIDLSRVPDAQTIEVVRSSTKRFFEIFNGRSIGDTLASVANGARYGLGDEARVDIANVIIAKEDELTFSTLKSLNDALEASVNDLVENRGLSRALPVATARHVREPLSRRVGFGTFEWTRDHWYYNHLYGQRADAITSANQCTIVRGSNATGSLMTEQNRGFNVGNVESDLGILTNDPANTNRDNAGVCFGWGTPQTATYWGGNTPINLDPAARSESFLTLKAHTYGPILRPIFDNAGASEITAGSPLTVARPENCLQSQLVKYPYFYGGSANDIYPRNVRPNGQFSCVTPLETVPNRSFESYYAQIRSPGLGSCTDESLFLDGIATPLKSYTAPRGARFPRVPGLCYSEDLVEIEHYFKKVPSAIRHTSPTDGEFVAALKGLTTPSLPSDRDRYIDFISARGNYASIVYPNLFRLKIASTGALTDAQVTSEIRRALDAKSAEINALIDRENPATLTGDAAAIANLMKISDYSRATDIDLYGSIARDPVLLASIVRAVRWYNLSSVSEKYAFVFEHSLDRDGNSPATVAGHRSDYEIAYLAAPGTPEAMHILLDSEKWLSSDIDVQSALANKQLYRTTRDAINLADTGRSSSWSTAAQQVFSCGPVDGVEITRWFSAIQCWLEKSSVPRLEGGSCGPSSFGWNIGAGGDPYLGFYSGSDNSPRYEPEVLVGADYSAQLLSQKMTLTPGDSTTIVMALTDASGARVTSAERIESRLEIVSVDAYSGSVNAANKRRVYELGSTDPLLKNQGILTNYTTFRDSNFPFLAGSASTPFGVKRAVSDITLRLRVKLYNRERQVIGEKTQMMTLQVRDERLVTSLKSFNPQENAFLARATFPANTGNKIELTVVRTNAFNELLPLWNVSYAIIDDVTEETLQAPQRVPTDGVIAYQGALLQKSGNYRIDITQSGSFSTEVPFAVIANEPVRITSRASSNIILAGQEGAIVLTAYDAHDNIATNNALTLKANIDGGIFAGASSGVTTLTQTTIDGQWQLPIRAVSPGTLTLTAEITDGTSLRIAPVNIRVIADARAVVSIQNRWNIVAGSGSHLVRVSILDRDNRVVPMTTVAQLSLPTNQGTLSGGLIEIVDGLSSFVSLTPGTVATREAQMTLQIAGIRAVEGNAFTILPAQAMEIALKATATSMEASSVNGNTDLSVTLRDRYGNIVYNHPTNALVTFRIPVEYQRFANFSNNVYSKTLAFGAGKAGTRLFATDVPGAFFVHAKTSLPLEDASVTIRSDAETTFTLSGSSTDALAISSYYLYNQQKVDRSDYNARYSLLLGAAYGDTTTPGALGNALIFNPTGRSTAVTSLTTDPILRDDALIITPAGGISLSASTPDRNLDIALVNQNTVSGLQVLDPVRSLSVADILWYTESDLEIVRCPFTGPQNLLNCPLGRLPRALRAKAFEGVELIEQNRSLLWRIDGAEAARIDARGRLSLAAGVSVEIDQSAPLTALTLRLLFGSKPLGVFSLQLASSSVNVLSEGENPSSEGISVRLSGDQWELQKRFTGQKTTGDIGLALVRAGSYSAPVADQKLFPKGFGVGLEQAAEEQNIGWNVGNRLLLEVSAGAPIGEAVRTYSSFATITLGDPLTSFLSNEASGFDATIGTKIFESATPVDTEKVFDFNDDGRDDLAIFLSDGHIRLISNYVSGWRDFGFLGHVVDSAPGRKVTGDFTGDGYDDIALASNSGGLIFIENTLGRFHRSEIVVRGGSIIGSIAQLESRDMDNDGTSDIILMSDAGELSVLYGTALREGDMPVFTKKVLDTGLGLTLAETGSDGGGAVTHSNVPQYESFYDQVGFQSEANPDSDDATDTYERLVRSKIFLQELRSLSGATREEIFTSSVGSSAAYSDPELGSTLAENANVLASLSGGALSVEDDEARAQKLVTFIRSEFAQNYGLSVNKTLKDAGGAPLLKGDLVNVTITLTNSGNAALNDVEYLDSLAPSFNSLGGVYALQGGTAASTGVLSSGESTSMDFLFPVGTIPARSQAVISYTLTTKGFSVGSFEVGYFETGETGDDAFGDIIFDAQNICGQGARIWRSQAARDYRLGTTTVAEEAPLPEPFASQNVDADGNGVPDSFDELIASGERRDGAFNSYASWALDEYNIDEDGNGIPDRGENGIGPLISYDPSRGQLNLGGVSDATIDALDNEIDDVVKGLGCGFGGGGCLSMPINWAPLAPGSSLSILGNPVIPPSVNQGIPIFSALTGMPIPLIGCVPSIFPISPLNLSAGCAGLGAGGFLGTMNTQNVIRLFVTPTLTGAGGVAVCFGPANIAPNAFPKSISPILPGGNCIVAAKPLNSCKADGSQGNVRTLRPASTSVASSGSGGISGASNPTFINAQSCRTPDTRPQTLSGDDRSDINAYLGGDRERLNAVADRWSRGGVPLFAGQPALNLGSNVSGDPSFETAIDIEALSNFELGKVIEIKNDRVSAFPDFVMSWVTRQLEEVVTKLTDLPTLFIILPGLSGANSPADPELTKTFSKSLSQQSPVGEVDEVRAAAQSVANTATRETFALTRWGLDGMMRLMSGIPLLNLTTQTIDISIPMITSSEVERSKRAWVRAGEQLDREVTSARDRWGSLATSSGAADRTTLEAQGLKGTIDANIRTIESYEQFPAKLQKFFGWKEEYLNQVLCNVVIIEELTSGFLTKNARRFKAWVELFVLIRAILVTWQGIIDLFNDYDAQCGVCRNERHDLKYWKFKMLSAIMPKIPVIIFPKWPDIILDLHNVRFNLSVTIPEFRFRYRPFILPNPPSLALPNTPSAGLSLPRIPLLPALPLLPDLPLLPSLPTIILPDLPPPPRIPKIFGGISATVNILRLFTKVLCILRSNPFVPEWRAGDQIAQITERQGKTPSIDFLSLEYPTFSSAYTDAIRLSTLVNYEFDTDFIEEAVRSAVVPINGFTSDLTSLRVNLPSVDASRTLPDIDADVGLDGSVSGETSSVPAKNNDLLRLARVALPFVGSLHKFFQAGSITENSAQSVERIIQSGQELANNADPRDRAIAAAIGSLPAQLAEAQSEADNMLAQLARENTEAINRVKGIVDAEKSRNAVLKQAFDDFFQGKVTLDRRLAGLPSLDGQILVASDDALGSAVRDFNQDQSARYTSVLDSMRGSTATDELSVLATSMQRKMTALVDSQSRRLAASDAAAATTAWANSLYGYDYRGIYVLEGSNQKRLFAYTDELDGDEKILTTDRDLDGDLDVIYRMGGSYYFKENRTNAPILSPIRDSIDSYQIDDILESASSLQIVNAPDYVRELGRASGNITLAFSPGNPTQDRIFELEYLTFIDRYDRSLSEDISLQDSLPTTRLALSHLVVESEAQKTIPIASGSSIFVEPTPVSFAPSRGDVEIDRPAFDALESGEETLVDASDVLYTASDSVITLDDGITRETRNIPERTTIRFDRSGTLRIEWGLVLEPSPERIRKIEDITELSGYPILPGTVMTSDSSALRLRIQLSERDDVSEYRGPIRYSVEGLGDVDQSYVTTLADENAWYYARLRSIRNDLVGTAHNLTLLAPQLAADRSAPLISPAQISVPVYQSQTVDLGAFITEASGIDWVTLDIDLTTDSDGNGIVDDDSDLGGSSGVPIRAGSTPTEIIVGPFDHLVRTPIGVSITDRAGNIGRNILTLQVTSPIPNLTPFTTESFTGQLNVPLGNEPVSLIRARGSNIEPITSATLTQDTGTFSGALSRERGLEIRDGSTLIASVDETTGVISLRRSGYSLWVNPASSGALTTISIVRESDQASLYDFTLVLKSDTIVTSDLTATGITVDLMPGMSLQPVPIDAPSIAGGVYIVDRSARGQLAIARNGSLYIPSGAMTTLVYDVSTRDFITIIARNAAGDSIARITYRVALEYILK